MALSPTNRAQDILRRIEEHHSQPETIKTCFGILAIMSRDDSHKIMIAVEGMERILNAMMVSIDRPDVQEAGCDLLWSLAFNNAKVKDVIGKYGGTTVLVRALKRHSKSADFLKSACGALSNLCQSKLNQHGFSSHGGIQPLVAAIGFHQSNARLLPFIFDALASLIVGNEENARMMSSQEGASLILSTLSKMRANPDVVKSGCHALAILSDVKGQANKIALGGGVVTILCLLDLHPSYADFHRVAAVVLLRMLQETPAIAREITNNEGVRILLKSLDKGGALEDTVAAVTHILSSITSPLNANAATIESQLWLTTTEPSAAGESDLKSVGSAAKIPTKRSAATAKIEPSSLEWHVTKSIHSLNGTAAYAPPQVSALAGLVRAIETYSERRDVVRAACRLLSHIIGFSGVVTALDNMSILDRVFVCVSNHSETKDVVESTASLLKAIYRRAVPTFAGTKPASITGLLIVFKNKIADDDTVTVCAELLAKHHAMVHGIPSDGSSRGGVGSGSRISTMSANSSFAIRQSAEKDLMDKSSSAVLSQTLEPWEHESMGLCFKALEALLGTDNNVIDLTTGLIKCLSQHRKSMSSSTKSTKMLNAILNLVEKVCVNNRGILNAGPWEGHPQLNVLLYRVMHQVSDTLTPKYSDIIRRIESILPSLTNRLERPSSGNRNLIMAGNGPLVNGTPLAVRPSRSGSESPVSSHGIPRPSSSSAAVHISSLGNGLVGTNVNLDRTVRNNTPRSAGLDSSRSNGSSGQSSTLPCGQTSASNAPPISLSAIDSTQSNVLDEVGGSISFGPLLVNWPCYLEKIITNPTPALNRSLDELLESSGPPRMHLVYECKSAAGLNIPSRCPITLPYTVPPGGVGTPFEHTLEFNSEFECGNIQCAIQRGERSYDLCLRPDLHTPGHTQWFYFAVSNIHNSAVAGRAKLGLPVNKIVTIQFNIINFTKPDSSFNSGMKPVVYSMHDADKRGIGWVRQGSDISYTANDYQRMNAAGEGAECYYTLSFSLEFQNVNDTYLIAYSYPYSYSDCRRYIRSILSLPGASQIVRHHRLCQTLGGKDCDLLIITNFQDKENIGPLGSSATPVPNILPAFDYVQEQARSIAIGGKGTKSRAKPTYRRGIFISARVHPGETPASWLMQGGLDYLTSSAPGAVLLRQNYVFFIVPMLNPDGVIFGNNRCSLAGVDLNRQWKIPMKHLHPTVFHLKTLIQEQKAFREIVMYIDLHGHSRKYNVFLYGCDDKKKPVPKAREFPRIFSQHDMGKRFVSLDDCSFHVKKSREGTARVVVCRDLNIPMSYTVEATFCGPDSGPLKFYHMNLGHLLDCGGALMDSILQYTIADGQFPEGTANPESFRGLTKIDQNSYLNPEERHRIKGPVCISLDDAKALLASGDALLRNVESAPSVRRSELDMGLKAKSTDPISSAQMAEKIQNIRDRFTKKDDTSKTSTESKSMEHPEAQVAHNVKEIVTDYQIENEEIGNDLSGCLSDSSTEDEEPDGMLGEEGNESVTGNNGPPEYYRGSGEENEDDESFIEAEDGIDVGQDNIDDDESVAGAPSSHREIRSLSVSSIDEELQHDLSVASRLLESSSPVVTKGVKTRTNLRALLDDKEHSVAGPIASQRIVDGIAMLPKQDCSIATLENIFKSDGTGSSSRRSSVDSTQMLAAPPIGVRTKRISRKNIRLRRQKDKKAPSDDESDDNFDIKDLTAISEELNKHTEKKSGRRSSKNK